MLVERSSPLTSAQPSTAQSGTKQTVPSQQVSALSRLTAAWLVLAREKGCRLQEGR
jgi:hypothetical protein